MKIKNIIKYLFSKVEKKNKNGCQLWKGYTIKGYGVIIINKHKLMVHRLVYENINGKIPHKTIIRRTCNNKLCCNINHMKILTDEERFWQYVDKSNINKCHPWLGFINPTGYSMFSLNRESVRAHRVVYELYTGKKIPKGMDVLHSCINSPSCCNPKHLRIGTDLDNAIDRKNQGRCAHLHGEKNDNSKLSDKQRKRICKLFKNNMSYEEIGKKYNVHITTIRKIVKNNAVSVGYKI